MSPKISCSCNKSLREKSTGLRVLEQLSRRKKGQKKAKKWVFDFSAIWKKGSISLKSFFFLFLIILWKVSSVVLLAIFLNKFVFYHVFYFSPFLLYLTFCLYHRHHHRHCHHRLCPNNTHKHSSFPLRY